MVLDELEAILKEATQTVEDELSIEDRGYIRLGATSQEIISEMSRQEYVKLSRLYYTKDPLAKQALRLWTDYTFGTGVTWQCEDEKASEVLTDYWASRDNQVILSAKGQRRNSTKLLVDGELFFALFLGQQVTVRLIDPLEITEIITDADDKENERYYKREWTDTQSKLHTDYYKSHRNPKDESAKDWSGKTVQATADAKGVLVYHLAWDNLGQRGMPLLLPAIDWIKQYRRFLASRVAIMLALAKFAWKNKVVGGAGAVATIKAALNDVEVPAGSVAVENQSSDLQPIRTDSNARGAYDDGRMLKLQVAAAVGIPEQYFGDISIGNLATAKTVELPMMKMFQSYQAIWADAYKDMDEIVLEHNDIDIDVIIDRDFPKIAPDDVLAAATAITQIVTVMPEFAMIRDVQQLALMSLGINNTAEVLDQMDKQSESLNSVRITKALRLIKESLIVKGNGHA